MVLLVFVDGSYPVCHFVTCLAYNLLSMNIGADSNIGRVGPSSSGGSNMVVSGQGSNMVVGGGQRRGNCIGGSKIGVDQSRVSLSLTLDNMLNWTILGNIFWAIDTIGHSSVVVGAVVAGDSVAGNSGGNVGGNSVDIWGSNSVDIWDSSDKWCGNMAVRVGSSSVRGESIAVDQGRFSLCFTLGNEVSVVERADDGGGVNTTIDTI